jgi:2-C-methyl-D-erythritol 4-phosphate cytidylyltransferase
MRTAAILLAAGSGERLGAEAPKAFVTLGERPLVAHSLAAMAASGVLDRLVLVVPAGAPAALRGSIDDLCRSFPIDRVVPGGRSRQESVRLGLLEVGDVNLVVCHDAARPFASAELFARVLAPLDEVEGVVPVVPVPDTVKVVSAGMIERTLPRDSLRLVQTPQAFRAGPLREVHDRAEAEGRTATDDAMLLEAAGYRVAAVEGEEGNFKVTTTADLARAEALLAMRSPS